MKVGASVIPASDLKSKDDDLLQRKNSLNVSCVLLRQGMRAAEVCGTWSRSGSCVLPARMPSGPEKCSCRNQTHHGDAGAVISNHPEKSALSITAPDYPLWGPDREL